MTYDLTCGGPGPHEPADGVLGTSSVPPDGTARCGSAACAPSQADDPEPSETPPGVDPAALIAAARDRVQVAKSIGALVAATLALDALRAQYPTAT